MARALTIAVFAVAAATTVLQFIVELESTLVGATGANWTLVVYIGLKALVVCSFAVMVTLRGHSQRPARDLRAFGACFIALACAGALHPPSTSAVGSQTTSGIAVAVIGTGWMLVSVLALGRCFGVLPEARGLVTRGPYRLVRHPLYLGEMTACAGLIIASPSMLNLTLGVGFAIGQTLRMRMEEEALQAAFEDYGAYATRTPRLLPWPRPRAVAASGDRLGASPGSA